jgi:hypothetical protein
MKLRSRSRSRRCIIINKNKPQSFDFVRINTPIWIETKQEDMFFNSFYLNQHCTIYVHLLSQQYLYYNHIQIIL